MLATILYCMWFRRHLGDLSYARASGEGGLLFIGGVAVVIIVILEQALA